MADAVLVPPSPPKAGGSVKDDFTAFDFTLYAIVIFAWGFSWYAIRLQLGVVDPVVSVAWRFWLAAALMFVWVVASGRRIVFPVRQHMLFAGLGVFLFSTNFCLFYFAGFYLVSGLLAVIFSTASILNVINAAIFLRERPKPKIVLAALMGAVGLALIFLPSIDVLHLGAGTLIGLAISLVATQSFSLGNMISVRVQRLGLPLVSSSAYGMAYGAAFMTLIAAATGRPFTFDTSATYMGSLVYLAVIATVIAFASYLTLLRRIGASRAAYITVIFPLAALAVSTYAEGYQWTLSAIAGLVLVIAGNLLMIRK